MPSLSDRFGDQPEMLEERQELIKRIEACMGDVDINDWEEEFLESLKEQVEEGRELSGRQEDKLDQIETIVAEGREAGWM